MLVALGAALFVLLPQQAEVSDADPTRVLQGLVAGINFLGAGPSSNRASRGRSRALPRQPAFG
jgi:putative Mg2+ transporter-C (MgtC) family protein